jgi:TolA-binding protein
MSKGDFKTSLKESRTAYRLYPQLLGDEALYQLGMVYAHPANPERDYQKSKEAFREILQKYPHSNIETEAEVWVMVLQEIQKLNQAVETKNTEIGQMQNHLKTQRLQFEEMNQDCKRRLEVKEQKIKDLNQNLDRLKEVDLKIEEKTN